MSCFCGHVEGLEGYEVFRGSKQPEDSSYVYIYTYTHILCLCILVNYLCIKYVFNVFLQILYVEAHKPCRSSKPL